MKKLFIILLCFCGGLALGRFYKPKIEYVYVKPSPPSITSIDDPRLIKGIIKAESRGNPKAVSYKGCVGLMQINYSVHKQKLKKIGITHRNQLFDPATNKKAGKFILVEHYKAAKGDLKQTLADYSGGAKWYTERVLYYSLLED